MAEASVSENSLEQLDWNLLRKNFISAQQGAKLVAPT